MVIAESDDQGGPVSVVGVGQSPSEGLRKGVVVNLDKTIASIQAAAVQAERMAGQRVESVIVSLAGTHLWSQNSMGVVAVARPDHEIGEDDVQRVVAAGQAVERVRVGADDAEQHLPRRRQVRRRGGGRHERE